MFDLDKVVYREGNFEKEFFYYDSRINLGCFKSKIEGDHPLDTLKALINLKDIVEKKDSPSDKRKEMENKFCLKDVEWICETRGVITVTHRPTKYFIKEFDGNTPINDLWSALKKLERIVNEHYQKESQLENEELKPIKLSDSCFGTPPTNELNYELRAKSLELAIASCGNRIGDVESYVILSIAKHFYTYIAKGE